MATVMPSPTNLKSFFSMDAASSPTSPTAFQPTFFFGRSSGSSDIVQAPPSPYPQHVDPSPVDSNGTENTEIEDDPQASKRGEADVEGDNIAQSPYAEVASPISPRVALGSIDTTVGSQARSDSEDAPQSVIHVPAGFQQFDSEKSSRQRLRVIASPTERSENTIVSPSTPEPAAPIEDKRGSMTTPLNTTVPSAGFHEKHTPRAQTRQEVETEWRRRSKSNRSLEGTASVALRQLHQLNSTADIPETLDADKGDLESPSHETDEDAGSQAWSNVTASEEQVAKLKTALSECWTLCNTLASLSSDHRERMFSFSGTGEKQEQAWESCWKLCQCLYESRDEDNSNHIGQTLELCRAFCQALFEARQRADEDTDSVLRVSFELNNHLYNTHDRNLPEAFRERTLDFYLTLCHRLMKQRTSLPQETDALLRACWSLTEILFSLRQNNREGKQADEELLSSAVQACWDLCDLFREGWTQIRPDRDDRATPKANQTSFPRATFSSSRSNSQTSSLSASTHSIDDSNRRPVSQIVPETPTTFIDDETADSPDEPNVPNILVLGPESKTRGNNNRWSSNASTLSGYSDTSSQRTTSTATASGEEAHIMRVKLLILKAAMNAGYQARSPSPSTNASTASSSSKPHRGSHTSLATFVKTLPATAFGTLPWQTKLLESYKRLVLQDSPSPRHAEKLVGRRAGAADVARAVTWMGRQGDNKQEYACLRDLYKLVFGFSAEEGGGGGRGGVGIST